MLFITILSQNILGLVTGRHSLLVGDIIIEEHFKKFTLGFAVLSEVVTIHFEKKYAD